MERTFDLDVQLAAAVAYSQSIRKCQQLTRNENVQQSPVFQKAEQFVRNDSASHSAIFHSEREKWEMTQIDQSRISSNVNSRGVQSQPYTRTIQPKTWVRVSTIEMNIPAKIVEWKNKLERLSVLFNSLCNGTISAVQIYADLHIGFRDLTTFLCYTSSTRRPVAVFTPVEIYAGFLVKLHQYCLLGTDNSCERLLYVAIHEVMSFWLRFLYRNNLSKYDRFWLHTRAVITKMLRSIVIQQCILAVKHNLASILTELTMLVLESGDYSYGFYASEQIEYLMAVLSHQTSHVDC